MKFLPLLCLAGALTPFVNAGTVVFDSITDEPSDGCDGVDITSSFCVGNGPLYASFSGVPGQITDLQLILSGDDTSSGSVEVGLYADNSGTPDTTSSPAVLGIIPDSLLSSAPGPCDITSSPTLEPCDITFASDPLLTAETYWIGLSVVGSSGTTTAGWSYTGDASDPTETGVADQFVYNGSGLFADAVYGPYQMQVTESSTPEPASFFLIVAGASVLALLRRRTA